MAAANQLFTCDSERMTFLRDLDNSERVEVTDWEARFIESTFKYQTGAVLFTDGQRVIIDRMFQTYGGDL